MRMASSLFEPLLEEDFREGIFFTRRILFGGWVFQNESHDWRMS